MSTELSFKIIGFLALVVSIILHEVAHAYAALRCGDPTARDAGRITLNPIPHIDLVGSIILPGFLILSGSGFFFAWAKPVPINLARCRNPREAYWITAIAGPLANLAQALVAVAGMAAIWKFAGNLAAPATSYAFSALMVYGIVNVTLMALNLIPIPPLDGSRVITVLLPREIAWRYAQIERYGFIILIALINMPFFRESFRRIPSGFVNIVDKILRQI
jgi:Zn-dependent proteases